MENKRGITLIALIITIIVLLILAGVTINVVVGDNGVLSNAQKAKAATELASEKELIEMAIVSSYTQASNYTKIGSSELRNELDKQLEEYIFNENADGSFTIKIENREYQISDTGTTIYIEHVVDTTPGVLAGSGTENSPYLIESVEDLVVFSYNVRSGNRYEGKYVDLKTNLNLASLNSYVDGERTDYAEYGYNGKLRDKIQEIGFIPIGDLLVPPDENGIRNYEEYHYFNGNFNGNYYTISNFNINAKIEGDGWNNFGLFSYIKSGRVKNLNVIGNIVCELNTTKFGNIGILVGSIDTNSILENCHSSGQITGFSKYWSFNYGGLVGGNSGTVISCYNAANVQGYSCSSFKGSATELRLGGVCGVVEDGGFIQDCYNIGNIKLDSNGEDCSELADYRVGGLAGRIIGSAENCYSVGKKENNLLVYRSVTIGFITAYVNHIEQVTKCFSLNDTNASYDRGCTIMNSAEMQSDDFVNTLIDGLETPVWKKDTGINNGYPILNWQ